MTRWKLDPLLIGRFGVDFFRFYCGTSLMDYPDTASYKLEIYVLLRYILVQMEEIKPVARPVDHVLLLGIAYFAITIIYLRVSGLVLLQSFFSVNVSFPTLILLQLTLNVRTIQSLNKL